MNIYKISCHSKCGSYFSSYLQSVTVIANDKDEAIVIVKKWLKKEKESFIYSEDNWIVETLEKIDSPKVIDYHEESDY